MPFDLLTNVSHVTWSIRPLISYGCPFFSYDGFNLSSRYQFRSISMRRATVITSDKGEVNVLPCLSVCLSVSLLARLLKNAWRIWMKCCVSTDDGTWTNWLTFEPDPDYSPDAGTGLLSPISYALQRGILLRRENPTYWYWAPVETATRGFEASKHRCRR